MITSMYRERLSVTLGNLIKQTENSNKIVTEEWAKLCLRTFAPIVSAHPYCARLHAQIHMPRHVSHARQVLNWTTIGQMAITMALLKFNDLGRSVTPTFLFRNRFYLQLSPHCSKMNKNSMWEVKKISRFLSTGHAILPSCGCKARETMVSKC